MRLPGIRRTPVRQGRPARTPRRRRAPAALLAAALAVGGLAAAGPAASPAAASPAAASPAAPAATAGNVTGIGQAGNTFTATTSSGAKARVVVARADIFRLWLSPDGAFTDDPAGTDLAPTTDFGSVATNWTDAGAYYPDHHGGPVHPGQQLEFSVYRADDTTPVWQEGPAHQLDRQPDHPVPGPRRRRAVLWHGPAPGRMGAARQDRPVEVDNKLGENTNASPAPFYMRTNGYGSATQHVGAGSYAFTSRSPDARREPVRRLYFIGDSLKGGARRLHRRQRQAVDGPDMGLRAGQCRLLQRLQPDYSGRPQPGPAPDHTRCRGYAADARAADMPSGWFLPNDGYGCGYTRLEVDGDALAGYGFHTGLWTSTGLANVDYEVGTAGARGVKTDVGWIGGGYKYAFDGVQQAVTGIENNTDARRYVWTVDGWAGAQRNAVLWTGDPGTWDYMRWQFPPSPARPCPGSPTPPVTSTASSAAAPRRTPATSSGSPSPAHVMTWTAGPRTTSSPAATASRTPPINRKYLKLRDAAAARTSTLLRRRRPRPVSQVRPLCLEYPDDPKAGRRREVRVPGRRGLPRRPGLPGHHVRDGIYLPKGTWTDYWTGRTTRARPVNGYRRPARHPARSSSRAAPSCRCGRGIRYTGPHPASPLAWDVYPQGSPPSRCTRTTAAPAPTSPGPMPASRWTSPPRRPAPARSPSPSGASTGSYTGKPASRGYEFTLHVASAPTGLTADGAALTRLTSKSAYDAAASGWFFDASYCSGVLWVKTVTKAGAFSVSATGTSIPPAGALPASAPIAQSGWSLVSADSQETSAENGAAANAFDGNPATLWHTAWSSAKPAPLPHEIQIDLGARYAVDGLGDPPRQDGGVNGRIGGYEVYVSDTTAYWGPPVASGTFADTAAAKTTALSVKSGRYLRLKALTEAGARCRTSAAEITLTGRPAPFPADATLCANAASASCVDLPHSATAPGTEPTLYTCHGGPNQRWTLQPDGRLTGLGRRLPGTPRTPHG